LAKEVIVVSDHAKRYMISEENVPEHRIHHINLAYDFALYERPVAERVNHLRKSFNTKILLLSVCRLTQYKRPELSIEVLKGLLQMGYNVKLVILGRGELYDLLLRKIKEENLEEHCMLAGYVSNVLEYMAASDYLVHPSLLESSSISLKEAGLVKLPIIVCKNIGDFNEVIRHGLNGFLVNPENFVSETINLIHERIQKSDSGYIIGENLQETVLKLFDIQKTALQYEQLFHQNTYEAR